MLGAAEGEYEFAAIRENNVPDRKPSHVSDQKPNDRVNNRFRKPRDGRSGRHTAHETDARDT